MSSNQNDEKKSGLDRFNKELNYSKSEDMLNDILNDIKYDKELVEKTNKMIEEKTINPLPNHDNPNEVIKKVNQMIQNNITRKNDENKTDGKNLYEENENKTLDDTIAKNNDNNDSDLKTLKDIKKEQENISKTQVISTNEISQQQQIQTKKGKKKIKNKNQNEQEQNYQEPKFVVDISEEDYNQSDFVDSYPYEYEYIKENQPKKYNNDESANKGKKRKKNTPLGIFIRLFIAIILVGTLAFGAIAGVYAYGDYTGIVGNGIDKKVTIPPDTYVSELGDILKENDIIKYPQVFRLYIKYVLKDNVNLHYGSFTLNSGMGYKELLNILQNPAQSESGIKVTIKEGVTVTDIATLLEENHICTSKDFLDAVANGDYSEFDFISQIENPEQRMYKLEGYLFPDTYNFKQDTPAQEVVKTLLNNFNNKLSSSMRYAIKYNSPFTIDEIVTLASIIQAEAPTKSDMMKVASVYTNRLENSNEYPKLQADPTSKYANRVLTPNGASQEMITAYDTYKSDGLPPGAINNPGLEALLSAIYPATTDYYYFCTDLTSGQFYYAQTYSEHQQNLSLAGLSE